MASESTIDCSGRSVALVFGTLSPTIDSRFRCETPNQAIGRALSDGSRLKELYTLRQDVNNMKTTVRGFSGRDVCRHCIPCTVTADFGKFAQILSHIGTEWLGDE